MLRRSVGCWTPFLLLEPARSELTETWDGEKKKKLDPLLVCIEMASSKFVVGEEREEEEEEIFEVEEEEAFPAASIV